MYDLCRFANLYGHFDVAAWKLGYWLGQVVGGLVLAGHAEINWGTVLLMTIMVRRLRASCKVAHHESKGVDKGNMTTTSIENDTPRKEA